MGLFLVLDKKSKPPKIIQAFLIFAFIIFSLTGNADTLSDPTYSNQGSIFTKQGASRIRLESGKNFTGQFDLVSNYVFRGISQTDNQPAAQAALAYSFLSFGLYVSLFGSNDDFPDNQNKTINYEIDPSVGITNKIGDHTVYDINLSRYIYPQSNSISYNELNSYLNYYFLTAQFSYSIDDYATGDSGSYYNLGFRYEIPPGYSFNFNNIFISGGIGYSNLPTGAGLHSYKDYNLALSKTINRFTFVLQWTDTDRQSTDKTSLKDNKIIAIISANI